jgi:hypothetical protein
VLRSGPEALAPPAQARTIDPLLAWSVIMPSEPPWPRVSLSAVAGARDNAVAIGAITFLRAPVKASIP